MAFEIATHSLYKSFIIKKQKTCTQQNIYLSKIKLMIQSKFLIKFYKNIESFFLINTSGIFIYSRY